MSIFRLYLGVGIEHILDFQGYDHILFVLTLCSVYTLNEWRRVLILVTAFTAGHTTTLVLAMLHFINIPGALIEFLIPVTIFITALFNAIFRQETVSRKLHLLKYAAALFFGLIHGLGFSGYLHSLLGEEASILKPLLAFNIGIEIGQVMVVIVILFVTWLVVRVLHAPRREWNLLIAGAALGISLILIIERIPAL